MVVGNVRNGVKKAVEALDGVESVEVIQCLDSARVVYLEEQVTPGCMVDAIKELGYQVGELKEEMQIVRAEGHFSLRHQAIRVDE